MVTGTLLRSIELFWQRSHNAYTQPSKANITVSVGEKKIPDHDPIVLRETKRSETFLDRSIRDYRSARLVEAVRGGATILPLRDISTLGDMARRVFNGACFAACAR